jgi:GNAT superfamily N-acetyltransferase
VEFDPAISLRLINNERLRLAQGWAEHRDLGGVLAMTSDAPLADLNCLEAFDTSDARIEGLLDIGFALLRAFDRDPAAHIAPLDRPKSLARRLERRGLRATDRWHTMVFRGDGRAMPQPADVLVRRAGSDDARVFANIHGGSERWVRRLSLASAFNALTDPASRLYLGYIGEEPVATAQLLIDGATAGVYAVGTLRSHRRKGAATALVAAAVRDAVGAGCDVIGLRTLAGSDAERLYARYGFEVAHESRLWEMPAE